MGNYYAGMGARCDLSSESEQEQPLIGQVQQTCCVSIRMQLLMRMDTFPPMQQRATAERAAPGLRLGALKAETLTLLFMINTPRPQDEDEHQLDRSKEGTGTVGQRGSRSQLSFVQQIMTLFTGCARC